MIDFHDSYATCPKGRLKQIIRNNQRRTARFTRRYWKEKDETMLDGAIREAKGPKEAVALIEEYEKLLKGQNQKIKFAHLSFHLSFLCWKIQLFLLIISRTIWRALKTFVMIILIYLIRKSRLQVSEVVFCYFSSMLQHWVNEGLSYLCEMDRSTNVL